MSLVPAPVLANSTLPLSPAATATRIDAARLRAVPPGIGNSIVFLRIHNLGRQDDFLPGVETPAAASAQLHMMVVSEVSCA